MLITGCQHCQCWLLHYWLPACWYQQLTCYTPILPHAEGTKDLAEILSERESIAHTMQVCLCIKFGRLLFYLSWLPTAQWVLVSLCLSVNQSPLTKKEQHKRPNQKWTEKVGMRVYSQKYKDIMSISTSELQSLTIKHRNTVNSICNSFDLSFKCVSICKW